MGERNVLSYIVKPLSDQMHRHRWRGEAITSKMLRPMNGSAD